MRRIKNTKALKESVKEFNNKLFLSRDGDFRLPLDRLNDLRSAITIDQTGYELSQTELLNYIGHIESNYFRILNADENEMGILINEFEKIIPHEQVQKDKVFWKAIVASMGYEEIRDKEMLPFLNKLGIKTCIYCHTQLTLTIKKEFYTRNYKSRNIKKGDVMSWKGLLALDHRHAKSYYPFLATSFYNLYPVCTNCNQSKNDKSCDFILYCDDDNLDAFSFKLGDASVLGYWADRDQELLQIELTPYEPQPAIGFSKAYEDMFDILKIYSTQKDIVEELVHKAEVYTKDYNAELIATFNKLFPDQGFLNRMIIGNYDLPEDMHKRPLAKFVQEIAKDLKLIT
jgi:hypothetical protein